MIRKQGISNLAQQDVPVTCYRRTADDLALRQGFECTIFRGSARRANETLSSLTIIASKLIFLGLGSGGFQMDYTDEDLAFLQFVSIAAADVGCRLLSIDLDTKTVNIECPDGQEAEFVLRLEEYFEKLS